MVVATGVEPVTFGSASQRSIQLSYATIKPSDFRFNLIKVKLNPVRAVLT